MKIFAVKITIEENRNEMWPSDYFQFIEDYQETVGGSETRRYGVGEEMLTRRRRLDYEGACAAEDAVDEATPQQEVWLEALREARRGSRSEEEEWNRMWDIWFGNVENFHDNKWVLYTRLQKELVSEQQALFRMGDEMLESFMLAWSMCKRYDDPKSYRWWRGLMDRNYEGPICAVSERYNRDDEFLRVEHEVGAAVGEVIISDERLTGALELSNSGFPTYGICESCPVVGPLGDLCDECDTERYMIASYKERLTLDAKRLAEIFGFRIHLVSPFKEWTNERDPHCRVVTVDTIHMWAEGTAMREHPGNDPAGRERTQRRVLRQFATMFGDPDMGDYLEVAVYVN